MGGGSKKNTATPAAQAQAAMSVPTTTFGAFLPPEQQGLLANQLSMGGYGTPEAISGLLANINKPVTMPLISTPDQIAGYLKQTGKTTVDAASQKAPTIGLRVEDLISHNFGGPNGMAKSYADKRITRE